MVHRLELRLVDEADGASVVEAEVRAYAPNEIGSFVSDARGGVVVEVPDRPRHISLRVRKEGFVPRLVVWDFKRPELTMPERFTLKLERGRMIGGLVQNQKGEPVGGATVLICLRGSRNRDRTAPRLEDDLWESPVLTDASGRWRFAAAPENLQFLHVRLEHPEYVSHENIEKMPPAEDFKNGTAVLILERGVPCEGTVTDGHGRPLEGVEVICGEAGAGSPSKPTRRTDARGHFRFGGITLKRRGEAAILSFRKEGCAPELVEIAPTAASIRQDVVMQPGRELRVRFTNKEGAPIAGVLMAVNHWRGHRPFHLAFKSGADGLVTWAHAPEDAIGYTVVHDSYQHQEVKLTAGAEVQTVVLPRHATISGRVIDAQTKEPVPAFRLTRGRIFHERHEWADWSHEQARTFYDGRYEVSIGRPVMMMNREGGPGEIGFHRVRVDANGYKPAISREVANEEAAAQCDFELERAASLEGTVRDAQGRTVFEAKVIVLGSGNAVMLRNGELPRDRHFRVSTNEEGRYVLPPQEETIGILVVHPEAGYFITRWGELRAAPDVRLQAWGSLEIATTAGDGSEARYHVRPASSRNEGNSRIRFDSRPVLSADGSWVFGGLAAGLWRVGIDGVSTKDSPLVTIENGKTARLDFRTGRRAVAGQILLPEERVATEEPLAHLRLRRVPPDPPSMPAGLDLAGRQEWFRAFRETPEGREQRRESWERTFRIDFQGRFRIDDMEPGHYKIVAIFFRALPREAGAQPDVAGLMAKDFELVAGDGQLDLGPLPVRAGEVRVEVHRTSPSTDGSGPGEG